MKDMLLERLRAWALAAVCGLMATVCSAQEGGVELRIAHTNDTHSCVMPVSPHSTDTALADKGRHGAPGCLGARPAGRGSLAAALRLRGLLAKARLTIIYIKVKWKSA